MNWFFYSLLAAISMSFYMVLCRVLLRDKGDSLAFTFVTTLFGGLSLILFLPGEKTIFSFSFVFVAILLALAFYFGIIDFLFIRGRQLEEIAKVSVALQSQHLWNVLGSVFIFGELFGLTKLSGILLIAAANLAVLWEGRKIHLSPGIKLVLLGTFLWTLAAYADKVLSSNFSALLYKSTLFILEASWLFLILGRSRLARSFSEFKLQGWPIVLVGPFLALANFFYVRAFQTGGEASRVLPIFSLSLIFSTLAGMIFLGERQGLARKLLALSVSFLGAYFINMA